MILAWVFALGLWDDRLFIGQIDFDGAAFNLDAGRAFYGGVLLVESLAMAAWTLIVLKQRRDWLSKPWQLVDERLVGYLAETHRMMTNDQKFD